MAVSSSELLDLISVIERKDIGEMPMPSFEQAEEMVKRWNNTFVGSEYVHTDTIAIAYAKMIVKIKIAYPELFI
jgi:hypothetical protein